MKSKRREMLVLAAQRGKYSPLYQHLKALEQEEWGTTFVELERILRFDLPDSARIYRPWWANQRGRGSHSQAMAWEMAGWSTSQVDMDGEKLVFVRSYSSK